MQSMPHLRPMATVVADSVAYGFDEDGGSIHDVIGTRRLINRLNLRIFFDVSLLHLGVTHTFSRG